MFAVAAIGQWSTFATLMSTPAAKLWSCLRKNKDNFRTSNVFQKPSYVVLKLNSPSTKLLSSIRLRYFHWWWPAAKICLELSQVNCQASWGFEFVPFTGAIVNIMMILMMIRNVGVIWKVLVLSMNWYCIIMCMIYYYYMIYMHIIILFLLFHMSHEKKNNFPLY